MSLAGKEAYRETSVGLIPAEWGFVPIHEIAQESTLRNGENSELPVILCSKHVGFVRSLDYFKKKIFSDDTSNYKVVKRNWIAYPSNHIEEGSIGLQRICDAGVVSPIYTVFLLNDGIEPDFIHRLLKTELYRQQYVAAMNGSVDRRGSLRWAQFSQIKVPLPPLPEQQKIAAILTAVDDKLDVIARQIEATRTLKQGLMQTLFSRGVGTQDAEGRWVPHAEFKDSELGEIPVGWTVVPLGELIEKLMDFRGRTPKKLGMDWGGGDIPALSANNVRMGYIDFDRECYLGSDELYAAWMVQGDTQKNDLVFTMEAPLGNVAVIPDDRKYILSQRVVLLRANQRVKHSYLFQYLRSDTFRKILEANSTGTTAKGIQQKRLVQLPVVVPPPEEQGRIADMLSAIDGKVGALQSKQFHHQTLKRGLMQKLLTGEWRVNVDPSATGT
jgi:type I restriction enzyme S subunit